MRHTFAKLILLYFITSVVLPQPVHSQSFSVDTTVTQEASQYTYNFTLNYDQAGQVQALADKVWDWSFYMDASGPLPIDVAVPTGWKESYDPASGQFDFYTEGPNGFGNGDFGAYVIQPGQSLSGFGLTTAAAPDLSIAFATDEQFNQDATTATLPTTLPAAVPEASTAVSLGIGILPLLLVTVRRQVKRKVVC